METVIIRVKNEIERQQLIGYSVQNGLQAQSFNSLLNRFIDTAPHDVPLTDDDIVAEVKKVRQDGAGNARHF